MSQARQIQTETQIPTQTQIPTGPGTRLPRPDTDGRHQHRPELTALPVAQHRCPLCSTVGRFTWESTPDENIVLDRYLGVDFRLSCTDCGVKIELHCDTCGAASRLP